MGTSSSCFRKKNPETDRAAIGTGVSRGTGRATAMASRKPAGSAEVKVTPHPLSGGGLKGGSSSKRAETSGPNARHGTSNTTRKSTATSSNSEPPPAGDVSATKRSRKEEPDKLSARTGSDSDGKQHPTVAVVVSESKVACENKKEMEEDDVTVSDLDIEIVELGGSRYRAASGKPILLRKDVFDEFRTAVASILHDEWRKPRLLEDGTYDPRPKEVAGKIYDIANLSFPELPHKFQVENAEAADIACSFVIQSVAEHGRWIPEELEIGSKQEHDAWMERNGSWAPPHQMLPYEELSREEKDKDRAIVLAAIDYLAKFYNDTIWADRSDPPPIDLEYLKNQSNGSAASGDGS